MTYPFQTILLRRGTAAEWVAANSVLAAGEIGVELVTGKFKIGNGTTAWNSLGYATDVELLHYFKLDQTVPQTVSGGMPTFEDGLIVGPPGYFQCDGNFYLGISDPTADLQIEHYCDGINAYILRSTTSDYSQFCYGINTVSGYAYIQSTHDGAGIVLPLTFWIHGSRIMDITSAGIGIGTTSPDTAFHIRVINASAVIRLERDQAAITTDNILGRLEVESNDTDAPGICAKLEAIAEDTAGMTGWRFSAGLAGAVAELMRLSSLGYLGIGVVDPDALLHLEHVTGAVQRLTRKDTAVSAADIIGRIEFETQDADSAGVGAFVQAEGEGNAGEVGLVFGTGVGGTAVERMRIKNTGIFNLADLPVYVTNALAVLGGLVAGDLYRTGLDPDTICIVH